MSTSLYRTVGLTQRQNLSNETGSRREAKREKLQILGTVNHHDDTGTVTGGAAGESKLTKDIQELIRNLGIVGKHLAAKYDLVSLGIKALPELRKLLSDKDSRVRCNAACAIGNIAKKSEILDLLKALTKLLSDENSYVRSSAAFAIGNIAKKSEIPQAELPDLLKALIKSLVCDEDSHFRGNAVDAIGNIAEKSEIPQAELPDVLKALIKLLLNNDEDSDVRGHAAGAIGNIAKKSEIPQLI